MVLVAPRCTAWFSAIPGELLDARFNNLLLEHLYQWFQGQGILWNPSFFYPYEHVLAFSDNHFGTGWLYVIARWIGVQKEQAFNFWFLAAYPLNFFASWYALKNLGFSGIPAAIGAFIFTFSLPVLGQANHAQLAYRFAIPLAFLWLERMLTRSGWPFFSALGYVFFWVGWQFACSIYLGFFFCFLAVIWMAARVILGWRLSQDRIKFSGVPQSGSELAGVILGVVGVIAVGGVLVPYAYVSHEYHFLRQDWEITPMVPRLASYLVSDNSWFSGGLGKLFSDLPMRNEHQLFPGFFPLFLMVVGMVISLQNKKHSFGQLPAVASLTLLAMLLLTTVVNGKSFYFLLIHLPLLNALRSVSRIELVALFPIAILCATGTESIIRQLRDRWLGAMFIMVISCAMLMEVSHFGFGSISISALQKRIQTLRLLLPVNPPKNGIIFLEKDSAEGDYLAEVDGMILAQEMGLATWNGYSGNTPPGHGDGRNFSDAIRQMAVYCLFRGYGEQTYRDLVARLIPLRCQDEPKDVPIPPLPELVKKQTLSDSECHSVSLVINSMEVISGARIRLAGILHNGSSQPLRSVSVLTHPVRYTWRWVAVGGHGEDTGYAMRCDLKWDVPPDGSERFVLDLQAPQKPGLYRPEVILIEEGARFLNLEGMRIPAAPQWVSIHSNGTISLAPATDELQRE